jgi:arylsulfatase A-like enzyme
LRPRAFVEPSHHRFDALPEHWREMRHCYFADIAHLDRQLGRILDALEARGRLEKTYIIMIADHGDMLLDHGFRGKENRHYDACIRVPLIVSGPGLKKGLVCDEIVQLEDIAPTVLELAGLPAPKPPRGPILQGADPEYFAGRSLVPLCRGARVDDWREYTYVESYNTTINASPVHWARTIRTRRFRYTYYPRGSGEQLFDLVDDPNEIRNLAGNLAYADLRRQMRDRLLDAAILQDYPHSPRHLFAHGVH